MNTNVVVISGNLTKDPEIKTVGDQSLAKLRVAVNKSVKKDGQWENQPMYFDVDVWGRTAEVCGQYLTRGSKVTVSGRLDWREWETDAGEKRQAVLIVASGVELPTKREAEQQSVGGGVPGGTFTNAPPAKDFRQMQRAATDETLAADDDDIPF